MAAPKPKEMVDKILAALAKSPAGVVSVSIDGQTVTYARKDALQELTFWEARAKAAAGPRPRVSNFNLSKAAI